MREVPTQEYMPRPAPDGCGDAVFELHLCALPTVEAQYSPLGLIAI
jgi:hypothetical protein